MFLLFTCFYQQLVNHSQTIGKLFELISKLVRHIINLFIYINNLNDRFVYSGFYVAFNTVQVISRWLVRRAEETSTYSSLGFCTVNCRPTASNYQLSHLRL